MKSGRITYLIANISKSRRIAFKSISKNPVLQDLLKIQRVMGNIEIVDGKVPGIWAI